MKQKCFVIGPMRGKMLNTLHWLAEDVVQKLLPDWEISTPDPNIAHHVMNYVIRSCDQAQLVIANTNGNNPNVLYEMAILDALGRACIPLKIVDDEGGSEDEGMPFDRAGYRYLKICKAPERRAETDKTLREAIEGALKTRAAGDKFENPLTEFFTVPLSWLSSAYGLARGYYINLVQKAAPRLPAIPGSHFDSNQYADWTLEIMLPNSLDQVGRQNVERLLRRNVIRKLTIPETEGREITLYEWSQQEGSTFRWVDLPTTLYTLKDTVEKRLGAAANRDPGRPEYKAIEADEIDQFRRALQARIHEDTGDAGAQIREVVELKNWNEKKILAS